MVKYNRVLAAKYAQTYAIKPNPKYYFFDTVGGDCTNFISQCLYAGGCSMNYNKYYGWFYINSNSRSPSWTSVNYLKRFLLSNSSPGPIAKICPINELEIGDIIQLRQTENDFNHSLIITKIEDGNIFVCAHSFPALNKPLSEYNYVEAIGLHILGYNL